MKDAFAALAAPFPRDAVHWRAQSLTRDGSKAMALAYIDARDVMRRLDEVVGPAHWQDSYTETAKGRVICTLSLFVNDTWIAKSDGAGDTDVEGDKGALSDAFKRAAVKWGVGRYLYDMPAPWVPCESYERNGKRYWSKWTADPWSFVKTKEPVLDAKAEAKAAKVQRLIDDARASLMACDSIEGLRETWVQVQGMFSKIGVPAEVVAAKDEAKKALETA